MMWQGEEETGTPYNTPFQMVFLCCVCSCYYKVDEDRSLPTINRHIRLWTLPNISHHWLFKLFWTAVMRHDTQVSLNDYWSMTEQLLTQLYSKAAMWHIPAHSFMPPLSEQSYCYWQWDRLWQTMEIKTYLWYAKQYLLKILCPFQTWLGVVVVLAALPSESMYPKSRNFWNKDLQIMWHWVDISIWYMHLLREGQDMWLHMMLTVRHLTRKVGNADINCMWRILYSLPSVLDHLMKGKDSDNGKGMPQDLLPWKYLPI